MKQLVPFVIYLGFCYACASLGKNRKLGFWGYFVASVLLSPVIGFILLLASDEKPPQRTCCPHHNKPV